MTAHPTRPATSVVPTVARKLCRDCQGEGEIEMFSSIDPYGYAKHVTCPTCDGERWLLHFVGWYGDGVIRCEYIKGRYYAWSSKSHGYEGEGDTEADAISDLIEQLEEAQ